MKLPGILLAAFALFSGAALGSPGQPPPPPSLMVTPGPHQVRVSWTLLASNPLDASAISHYRIYRSTDSAGPYALFKRFYAPIPGGFSGGTTTVYVDANASPVYGNTYHYKVEIYDAAGGVSAATDSGIPTWSTWHRFRGDSFLTGRSLIKIPGRLELVWKQALPSAGPTLPRGQVYYGGRLYTVASDGYLRNYDGRTGFPGTSVSVSMNDIYVVPTIDPDGIIYFANQANTNNSAIHAYGAGVSPTSVSGYPFNLSTPTFPIVYLNLGFLSSGNLFMGTQGGFMYGVNPQPKQEWFYMDGLVPAYGSVTLHNGNTCYMVMRSGPNVMCLSPDGELVWTRTLSGTPISKSQGSPLIMGPKGEIYAATTELAALNPEDGSFIWGSNPSLPVEAISVSVGSSGNLFVVCGAQLRCINPENGALIWTVTIGGGTPELVMPPVVTSDGKLVFSYMDTGKSLTGLQILSEANGDLLWGFGKNLSQSNLIALPIATADGWVYLLTDDGTYAFAIPPDLKLSKKVDKTAAMAGDTLRYTISWSNASAMTAVNLWVWDSLPNGTKYMGTSLNVKTEPGVTVDASYAASFAGPWSAGEPSDGATPPLVMQWKISSVGAFASGELSFGVTLSSTLNEGDMVRNQASATNFFGSTTTYLESQVATTLIGPPPDPPTNLTVFVAGTRYLGLAWEKPVYEGAGGVGGYNVYRSDVSDLGPFEKVGETSGAGSTGFVDAPLTNGVEFFYVVTAKDSSVPPNESVFSAPANGTSFEPPAPYVVAWVKKAPLKNPRWGHELQTFGDFLYAFGGDTGSGLTGSMERLKFYGPTQWEGVPYGGAFTIRSFFGSVKYKDEFYAVGGYNGASEITFMQKFNPTTTSWSDVTNSGFDPVSGFPMISDPVTGFFTAFAGYKSPSYSDRIQWFVPSLSTWMSFSWPTVMTPRRDSSAAASGLSMFLSGGELSTAAPTAENFEFILFKGELIRRSSMPAPRKGAAGAALDSRVYSIGGVSGSYLSDVIEYNPATDSWTPRVPLPVSLSDARAVQGIRKIYVAGGRDSGGNALANVYEGTPLNAAEGENKIGLSWGFEQGTYPLAAAPFTVYRTTFVAMSLAERGSPMLAGISASVFTDTNVTNGNFYEYFVDAVDSQGNMNWVWDLVWLPATAPQSLSALPGSNQIALSWDRLPNAEAENIVYYAVYRSTFPEVGQAMPPEYEVGGAGLDETVFIDKWLTAGIPHYYVVRAVSRITGPGRACATVMETPVYIAPPGIPENPTVSALPEQVVSLKWTSPPAGGRPISGYRVYRSTSPSIDPTTQGALIAVLKLPVASGSVYFELLDQAASAAYGNSYSYTVVAMDDWNPPTVSLPSNSVAVLPAGGYYKSGRADPYGTGRSQAGPGLSTSLALRWQYSAGGAVLCAPVVDPADGSVFFTSMAGKLHKLPPDGGAGGWSVNLGPGTPLGTEASPALAFTTPAGAIGLIYAAYSDGAAGGVSAFTPGGVLAWSKAMPAAVRSNPLVLPDGGVMVGDDSGTVRVFSVDGTQRWSRTIPGGVSGPILLLEDGGGLPAIVGVGSATGRLYGLRIFDGAVVGHLEANGAPTGAVYNPEREELYVSTLAGNIHVYSFLGDEEPKTTFTLTATGGGFVGALAFDRTAGTGPGEGTIFATNTNGSVYRFNVADPAGTLKVENLGSPSRSSAAVGSGKRVYWGDDNGRLWEAREASTAYTNSLTLPLPGAVGKASPAFWKDGLGRGVVYCGSESGLMCAFVDAPHVPGPVAAAPLPEKIALSWTVSGDGYFLVSGYRIFRATCSSCGYSLEGATWNQFATSYVDTGLQPGFRYYYRICAFDDSSYANQSFLTKAVSEMPAGGFLFSVRKDVLPAGEVCAGSSLAYTFSWSNTGSSTVYGITITDTLPNGTSYKAPSLDFYAEDDDLGTPALLETLNADASVDPWAWTSGEPPDGTASPLVLRWIVNRAAPGRTGWLRFSVGISSTLSDGSIVSNAASATVAGDSTVHSTAQVPTTVRLPAVLESSVYGPGVVSTGQVFSVVLSVTNTGYSDAEAVSGAIALGPGQALVSLAEAPSGSLILAPGGSTVFEWVYAASSPGLTVFTASATGTTCGGTVITGASELSTTILSAASLSGALDFYAGQISVGQPFLVTLTVTNTGGAAADSVAAAGFFSAGTGAVGISSGPWPAMPVSLGGGEAIVFTWTYSGASSGTVEFTTTVTGSDSNSSAALSTGALVSGVLLVQTPASLYARISPYASSVCEGGNVLVTVTVSNTGEAATDGFSLPAPLVSGTGGAAYLSGPQPAIPSSLSGSESLTFSYTYTGVSSGGISLSTTATGTDVNSGAAVSSGTAVSPAISVVKPGSLSAVAGILPAQVSVGQTITVTLTATNTGQADVTGVSATLFVGPGGSLVSLVSAPSGGITLSSGLGATFTWVYAALGSGTVTFTASAQGSTCTATDVVASAGASALIQTPAALEARLVAFPDTVIVGETLLSTLTVTNTGEADAAGVYVPEPLKSGTGNLALSSAPAMPVYLPGGSAVTLTWTYTGFSAGTLDLSATASGTDANSGLTVTSPVAAGNLLTVLNPPLLASDAAVYRNTVSVGQAVLLTLTVTNQGGATATDLKAAAWKSSGTGGSDISAVTPVLVASLPAGSSATFSWTVTATAAGTVNWSGTVTASGPYVSNAVTASQTVQTPASLSASSAVLGAAFCAGQDFLVTVTVTNTGTAAADGLGFSGFVLTGGGGAVYKDGPSPSVPVSIGGNSAQTFTWTYTGSSVGQVVFTTVATAVDANSGGTVSSGSVATPAVSIADPGALSASASAPAAVSTGQQFQVILAVSNTGGSEVTGIAPSIAVGPGGSLVSAVSGPSPAGLSSLAPAGTGYFTWVYRADSAGAITFSATASGVTCGATALSAWNTANTTAVNASSIEGDVDVYATQIVIGQNVTVTLTLTNAGDAVALSVTVTMAPSDGSVSLVSGPASAALSIGAGASRTYIWVYSGAASGNVSFTGSASWTDELSGTVSTVSVGPSSALAVLSPAALSGVLNLLLPGGNSAGDTVRAEFTVANTGQAPGSVTGISIVENESSPGVLGAASAPIPPTPVTISGGSAAIFTWDYTAGVCGTASVSASASGSDVLGGAAIGTGLVTSGEAGIAGTPDLVVGTASPDRTKVGGVSELTFRVLDNCSPVRIPVSGVNVSMVVIAGGGLVSPSGGTTDAGGEVRTTLRLGSLPGTNAVRADVIGAPLNPGGTVFVEGTIPDTPASYLSRNFFDPSRNERLQLRVTLPSPMRIAVRVYNLAGEAVRKLADFEGQTGLSLLEWDGRNDKGAHVGNGVYFIQIVTGSSTKTLRVIVLKK